MSKNITEQSVFGTYFQTENQVTSALLKILETDCRGGSLLDRVSSSLFLKTSWKHPC